MKKKVCVLLDNQTGITATYNACNYDWDSFIWGFEQDNIDCFLVGEHSITDYKDILEFGMIILEAYPSLSKFMIPIMQRESSDRPIVVVLEARSNHIASFLDNNERMEFFSWVKEADYTSIWCHHGVLLYQPKYEIEIVRPVPFAYREYLLKHAQVHKQDYLTSPIYMRGTGDYNIYILYELGKLCGRPVKYSVQFDKDAEFWKDKIEVLPLLALEEQCKLFSNAFCNIKFWPTNSDIGGRASYMLAKIGSPYISTPAMIQNILYPALSINPYGGIKGILNQIYQLEDKNFYESIIDYARSRCHIIEQGGSDWKFLINQLK